MKEVNIIVLLCDCILLLPPFINLFDFFCSYLNENELKSIAPGMFPMLSHLHTLSLAQNRIATIERGSFPLPRLRHL